MIKQDKVLSILQDSVDPEHAQGTELVLENAVMQQDALLHIGWITGYVLTLGRRGLMKFYDLDKLNADGIYVHRRPYGGSGTLYGPNDVVFSLYINKASFIDGFDVSAQHAHRFFNWHVCSALNALGLTCHVDERDVSVTEDGVCMHTHGRTEVVNEDNQKMAASVFREDELGFYMRCLLLVSDDWTKVYNYLQSPIPQDRIHPDSIERRLGHDYARQEVALEVTRQIALAFNTERFVDLTPEQKEYIRGLRGKYRVV